MNPQWIITAGAVCFFVLGSLHLRLTVMDMKSPRAFIPAKRELLDELQNTRINLRKDVKNFWLSYLGFHFSHSAGILFYSLVVMYCALVRPDVLSDMTVRMGLVGFGAAYVLMARAFWFVIPLVGSLLGVSLIAIGLAMLH